MAIAGIGALSSFGFYTEVTPGTPVSSTAPNIYLPITSESVGSSRNPLPSGSIVGDSMVQAAADGVITVEGGFQMEFEGSVCGNGAWLWNGNNGYSYASINATNPTFSSSAPSLAAPSTGGSLTFGTTGVYKYKISTVLQRTADGKILIMPASAEATSAAVTTGNQTVVVSWTAITAPHIIATLPGHTLYGTIVWRTAEAGATGTEHYAGFVSGSTATYSDSSFTGDVTACLPYTAVISQHTLIGTPPVSGDRLKTFTWYGCKDNDSAEMYTNCMMDQMKVGVPGIGEKVMMDFTLKGTTPSLIANFTPTFVPLQPFVGWQAKAQIGASGTEFGTAATADCSLENFSIECSNGVVPVPGLCMTPYNRGVISGKRTVNVTFARQFSDHSFWTRMINGTPFSVKLQMFGQSLANPITCGLTAAQSGLSNVNMVPFEYYTEINIPQLKASKAGGSVGGPDRIVESISCIAFKDVTAGTEMRIDMWNTVTQYV